MMTTSEFPRLGRSPCEIIARALALLVVLLNSHFWRALSNKVDSVVGSHTLAATTLLACVILSSSNSAACGLVLRPHQGWGYWARFSLIAGGVILVLGSLCGLVWWIAGWPLLAIRRDPSEWHWWFCWMCIDAPIHEEIVYRSLLTIALLPALGFWGTIGVGGVVFGLIHVVGGNPGPDNLIAGFFLGWAYLRSGTILVPLAMHAAGNAFALSSHLMISVLVPE